MQLVHHSDRVFSISALLNPEECQDLISLAEAHGFSSAGVRTAEGQRAMPSIRNNERTMFENKFWVQNLWDRLSRVVLPSLEGQSPAGLPNDLRFYKYSANQRFKMHKDGPWNEGGLSSKLTLLVYLNDAFEGGATDFRTFSVSPTVGSALLFIHDTWHEGCVVTAGTKYVLRSDVLYRPAGA